MQGFSHTLSQALVTMEDVSAFWESTTQWTEGEGDEEALFDALVEGVTPLASAVGRGVDCVTELGQKLGVDEEEGAYAVELFRDAVHARIRTGVGNDVLEGVMELFYRVVLRVLSLDLAEDDDDDEDEDDDDEDDEDEEEQEQEEDEDGGQKFMPDAETALALLDGLEAVGLNDAGAGVATKLLYKVVEVHVERAAEGVFDEPYLDAMLGWMDEVVGPAIKTLRGRSGDGDAVAQLRERLWFHFYQAFGRLRIRELFDIIVDFPESRPAVGDLKRVLARTWQHEDLISSLAGAYDKRLLHLGANTADILGQYVSSIKVMGELDSTGVMLESVSNGIRRYLKRREDTIRCIVTSLTDPSPDSLLGKELVSASSHAGGGGGGERRAARDADYDSWMPAPSDASGAAGGTGSGRETQKSVDIISMLVNIYGSQELFVNEYKVLLASRLLAITDYNTDNQVRNCELLKLRFGEASLLPAEIMLKDVADSKRINAYVHSHDWQEEEREGEEGGVRLSVDAGDLVVSTTVISKLYWPPLKEVGFTLPEGIKGQLDVYGEGFHTLKTPRKLSFIPNLGSVDLELTFEDQSLEMSVSPLLATIISHFDADTAPPEYVDGPQVTWPLGPLAEAVGITPVLLRKTLVFWLASSVLEEVEKDKYASVVNYEEALARSSGGGAGTVDLDSGVASTEDQKEEELRVYQSYVSGMLSNLGALPAERIHNMLKIFVADSAYTASLNELVGFLNALVRKEELVFGGGVYSLPK